MEHRRRAPRIPTDWLAWFRLEDPTSDWRACRVLDISLLGVGVVTEGVVADDLGCRRLHVQAETPIGEPVRLYLHGRVANQAKLAEATRIGLEFDDLSENGQAVLQVVEHLKCFW